ncbi:MAG TPA: adenylate/guanylate cyclase domain-containing protein [Acidimicrobiia bacterium]
MAARTGGANGQIVRGRRGGAARDDRTPPEIASARDVLATVCFLDIVDSTRRLAELGDRRWRAVLADYRETVRSLVGTFDGREVKALGDGSLLLFDRPALSIRCSDAIRQSVSRLAIEVRTGIHAGEVELEPDDVYGIVVHISERICALARPSEVLVSRTVKELVAGIQAIQFVDRGLHELKGVPGRWRLFAVRLLEPSGA